MQPALERVFTILILCSSAVACVVLKQEHLASVLAGIVGGYAIAPRTNFAPASTATGKPTSIPPPAVGAVVGLLLAGLLFGATGCSPSQRTAFAKDAAHFSELYKQCDASPPSETDLLLQSAIRAIAVFIHEAPLTDWMEYLEGKAKCLVVAGVRLYRDTRPTMTVAQVERGTIALQVAQRISTVPQGASWPTTKIQ